MLRALWFLLKISMLAGGLIWLAHQPENWVTITAGTPVTENPPEWGLPQTGVYEIQVQSSFLIFLLVFTLFIATRLDRIWRAFVSVPKVLRRYRALQNVKKVILPSRRGWWRLRRATRRALIAAPDAPRGWCPARR